MRFRLGTWLVAIPAIASITIPVLVDWNTTHLFNHTWPPHARLHDAMSFFMSMGLGVASLWLLRRPDWQAGAAAALLASWSWISLLAAGFIPGTSYSNAAMELSVTSVAGIPLLPNTIISVVLIIMSLIGWLLLRRAP